MKSISPQDSIIMMDSKGDVVFWNKASEIMFGWTAGEAMGRKLHELIVPDMMKASCEKGIRHYVRTGEGHAVNRTLELTAKHKDGHEFPVELTLGALRIAGGWTALGVVRDVARMKELEFQLIHAEKMESIATMAGGIAHDFNNILASIIGFTELAMDDAEKGTVLYGNLQEVLIASNRAKDLVRQILKFSRQTGSEPEPIHVKSVVEDTLKLIRASFPSTIDIRTDLRSEAFIMADSSHVHQIVLNLCSNAENAMEDRKGVLTLSLTDMAAEEVKAETGRDVQDLPHIRLSVSDTGVGMSTDILGKAFTPFFTTKKQGEGSGMGLSIVHGIVTSLKGRIYPHSEPGKGSTFHIYLPALKSAARSVPVKNGASRQGEHILFVDDEASIVKIGKRLLEKSGYTVEAVESSETALELFKASPDKYRLVITDLTMPRMTGIELARAIMAIRPDIPVILCTGYEKNQSIMAAMKAGIKAVVTKPILSDEIAETIGRVLNPA